MTDDDSVQDSIDTIRTHADDAEDELDIAYGETENLKRTTSDAQDSLQAAIHEARSALDAIQTAEDEAHRAHEGASGAWDAVVNNIQPAAGALADAFEDAQEDAGAVSSGTVSLAGTEYEVRLVPTDAGDAFSFGEWLDGVLDEDGVSGAALVDGTDLTPERLGQIIDDGHRPRVGELDEVLSYLSYKAHIDAEERARVEALCDPD